MKRTFEIEFRDDLGPMWMNEDNLAICLKTQECCGDGTIVAVRDKTSPPIGAPRTPDFHPDDRSTELLKYVQHLGGCRSRAPYQGDTPHACTCGLEKLLAAPMSASRGEGEKE